MRPGGAEPKRWASHHAVEQHLLRSGVSYTLLRPGFFAQNLGDAYRHDIRERSEIVVPAGRGRVAFVDVRLRFRAAEAVDPTLERWLGR
jgi:uncharacterized protein YbjT (DUF2867 family)